MLYINTYNQSRLSCWEVSLHVWAVRLWRWEATAAESCDRSLVSLNQINEGCDLGLSGILDKIDNHLPLRRTFSHRIQANWIAGIQDQKSQIRSSGILSYLSPASFRKGNLELSSCLPGRPKLRKVARIFVPPTTPPKSSRPNTHRLQYQLLGLQALWIAIQH